MPPFALGGNGLLAARVRQLAAELAPATPREALRLPCTLLPVDSDRRTRALLWAELIARGCADARTWNLPAGAYASLTGFLVRQVTGALPGRAADGTDAFRSAWQLVSVIEGLRWPLLLGASSENEAVAVLGAQLGQAFGAA